MLRYDWTVNELREIFDLPFPELIFRAQGIHRQFFRPDRVQCSTLLSVKTGGCSEDCGYCSQSSRYETGLERRGVLPLADVLASAQAAKEQGASRFCMGAAWRQVKDNGDFEQILEMVREVSSLGLQVCCTLGMLTPDQAVRLKEAGCYAYNHNLDTSPEYYDKVVTTRTYQDRLNTLAAVREAGMTVCCGGIIGLGEASTDRLGLVAQLACQNPHPESVPINMLVPIEGTPLGSSAKVDPFDFVRIIATARIAMPNSMVRLSAGRLQMSPELQALCFLAGANSIFLGDKLLTTDNPAQEDDFGLLSRLGMEAADDMGVRGEPRAC